jgi:hypothetical protein
MACREQNDSTDWFAVANSSSDAARVNRLRALEALQLPLLKILSADGSSATLS